MSCKCNSYDEPCAVALIDASLAGMTPEQKRLVQTSFALVEPIADAAAALFYGRLFELEPGLRGLFKHDMKLQGTKLMHVLGIAVRGLDRPDDLLPVVAQLGSRHAGYGVQERHYQTVAEALLWTLERGLGPAFTPAVRDAWVAVYGLLASTMQQSASRLPGSQAA
jgi:hemoglobin-like flavoprotein